MTAIRYWQQTASRQKIAYHPPLTPSLPPQHEELLLLSKAFVKGSCSEKL